MSSERITEIYNIGRHFVAHYDYIEKFNSPTATFREPLNEDQMKARLFAVYVCMPLNRRQRNESEAIFPPKIPQVYAGHPLCAQVTTRNQKCVRRTQ